MAPKRKRPAVQDLLTEAEIDASGRVIVWPVWWETPDKSWEAFCLGAEAAARELAARQADELLRRWGKVGCGEQRSLLEWCEGRLRTVHASDVEECIGVVREVLRRAQAGDDVPLILRTW